MKKITLLAFCLFLTNIYVQAQCNFTSQFPAETYSALNSGSIEQISSCSSFGEFSVVDNLNIGDEYQFDGDGGYITITDAADGTTVLSHGASPLSWVSTAVEVEVHWAENAVCDIDFNCHVTTVQNLDSTGLSNDDCATAQSIIQETGVASAGAASATSGTIDSATSSGMSAQSCGGTPNDDVWYSFEALTSNVTLTLELDNFDGIIELYSGSCGSLSAVSCADNTEGGPALETINSTSLVVGETYYVRVFQWGPGSTTGKTFDLKIWSSDTLGVDEVESENAFTYFPNPVKNELNLKAQSNIQNVSIYNMLGQEVVRTAPNSLQSEVSMSNLSNGAYFVKVTINDVTETIRIIKQ
ncbi:hypothetical protein DMZ43_07720 [Meridianimaribacter sp. CL38]|uniref:T9SS type A sorting domain-containing protein n=1 Tax=Meridianimaribacter sp. CL38 TaxID=2213021 RepID=UPI00103DC91C|nr:T9SS type A sorting domain-containing protein [Meridianimaribacter sp. CL38]TBV26941.1 hypothetical protein DMZ43_07720 [Meridianimaribacter sp. CL38]